MTTAGLVALWRYPVKSMQGEELNAGVVTDRGLVGDRAYALVDRESGKLASAKHPKKWPGLFECRASFVEPPQDPGDLPPVRITLPDGTALVSDDGDVDRRLSALVGREVTLSRTAPPDATMEQYWPDIDGVSPRGDRGTVTDERVGIAAPPGTFFDAAPLHVLTVATLDRLARLHPGGRYEARRFRPNLVVDVKADSEEFPENRWVGRTLRVADAVRLPILAPVPRCVMTTLAQGDLPPDPGILRTPARHNRIEVLDLGRHPCVGAYGAVAAGGRVARGDPVRVE
jgi:MOSC domain-containing protein